MAKTSRTKTAGERQVLVHYDQALPEIPDRLPHELPSSYLRRMAKEDTGSSPDAAQASCFLCRKFARWSMRGALTATKAHPIPLKGYFNIGSARAIA